MPSSLRKFSKRPSFIPKSLWKGAGYYYNRGEGRWTKYSKRIDKKRGNKVGTGKMRHTHDIDYTKSYLRSRKG